MSELENEKTAPADDMHVIPASAIAVGVRFSEHVYFSDKEHLFLSAGCEAKLYHEEALARWNISTLCSRGHLLSVDEALQGERAPNRATAKRAY